eukprot:3403575-Pleurochrysis_carterae.AAC.1
MQHTRVSTTGPAEHNKLAMQNGNETAWCSGWEQWYQLMVGVLTCEQAGDSKYETVPREADV